ncbi:hypothetical protein F7725_026195 [Dissostichus mawsoni]|uniref:Uncharacterized protein n=1 Tax=Dissostichus mawsoni TaxID=36200 RepID=A0A7J5X6B6_DISMA|nr:hypothetical protein F7725_026195 [Dissostichus mawsoni]
MTSPISQARRILKTSRMEKLQKKVAIAIKKTLTAPQLRKLEEGEQDFWNKLIDRYLTPINDSQAHKDEVTRELKSLRNKAVFLYFIINVLWVVATFFLQAIGNDVISIKIPKYLPNGTASGEILKVEPLSLMFLLSFAVLLLVQFLAMLYHRVYTLIHVVSYRSSEKDYRQKGIKDPVGFSIIKSFTEVTFVCSSGAAKAPTAAAPESTASAAAASPEAPPPSASKASSSSVTAAVPSIATVIHLLLLQIRELYGYSQLPTTTIFPAILMKDTYCFVFHVAQLVLLFPLVETDADSGHARSAQQDGFAMGAAVNLDHITDHGCSLRPFINGHLGDPEVGEGACLLLRCQPLDRYTS